MISCITKSVSQSYLVSPKREVRSTAFPAGPPQARDPKRQAGDNLYRELQGCRVNHHVDEVALGQSQIGSVVRSTAT